MPSATPAPFNVPAKWTNGPLTLYHGTLLHHAHAIKKHGVNPTKGRVGTDFGPGFYTTTLESQAKSWAWLLANTSSPQPGAVVELTVDRSNLATMQTLAFVRGHYSADDYWSFVFHCRLGAADHARGIINGGFYDLVYGPVAAFWAQRSAMADSEQISFHTRASALPLHVQKVTPI